MYKIGELSKLSRLPVKTLRYYGQEGLLVPDYIDEETGYRYYNAGKLSDCYRIIMLKGLGFSLGEIKELLSLPKENFSRLIQAKEDELLRLKAQTEERLHLLRTFNLTVKENASMYDIIIRKSDNIRLAYRRTIVSRKEEYGTLLAEMRRLVPDSISGSRTVIIDYETEFVSQDFDTGFGVEITGKLPKASGLCEKEISFPGDTASLVCSDTTCEEGIRALHKYVLDHDYQITGPVIRINYEDGTVEIKLSVAKLGEYDAERNEELNLPFVNDEDAVGRWERFDCLPCREMFHPRKQKSAASGEPARELYFLPGGERYWCFGWTKGMLLSSFGYPRQTSRNKYTIQQMDGETFLFVELKGRNYFRGGLPEIWVFRKADSRSYTRSEIRITDEIPEFPADDASVIGEWNACDCVRDIDSFHPDSPFFPYEGLYWRRAEFLEGGAIRNSFQDAKDGSVQTDEPHIWSWVTGYVICHPSSTVSRYLFRELAGVTYLFIQWKSGDYSYGGSEPCWYVFQR